jgi:hypothetical protein
MSLEVNPEHSPEVTGPNDRPRPDEFETSQVIYGDGFPYVPEPEWMKQEAEIMKNAREQQVGEPEVAKRGRLRTLGSIINAEFFWHGQITDSDYRDRQNGIVPPFEP